MDDHRFDALTRILSTRRTLIGSILALVAPAWVAAQPRRRKPGETHRAGVNAEQCVANGQRCGKGSGRRGKPDLPCKTCCSRFATPTAAGPRRCSCTRNGDPCGNSAQCCGGQCTGGACGPCNPGLTNCPGDGCVDVQTSGAHCGSCGVACDDGQVCQNGTCACTPGSCPGGCCTGAQCKPGTGDAFCGAGGGVCAACGNGQRCAAGVCICDAASCPNGCCVGGVSDLTLKPCGSACIPLASCCGVGLPETVTVPSDGNTVRSVASLEEGIAYRIRASGDFQNGANRRLDAEYSFLPGPPPGGAVDLCGSPSSRDLGLGIDDPTLDLNKTPKWGPFAANHVYETSYTGTGAPAAFRYQDCNYADNTGTMQVEISCP